MEEFEFEENGSLYDKLKEISSSMSSNLTILEEKIDIAIQMEYFKLSKDLKDNLDKDQIYKEQNFIFDKEYDIELKKNLLIQLASIDDVTLYRKLEQYAKSPDKELKEWSILALQESKMHIESSLLDENQLFISTGLGGKGTKLRYFSVLIGKNSIPFDETMKKLISSELEFSLKKANAEIEKIKFSKNYAIIVSLIPLQADIRTIFKSVINECNKLMDFLRDNFLITNVKEFTLTEIEKFIAEAEQKHLLTDDENPF